MQIVWPLCMLTTVVIDDNDRTRLVAPGTQKRGAREPERPCQIITVEPTTSFVHTQCLVQARADLFQSRCCTIRTLPRKALSGQFVVLGSSFAACCSVLPIKVSSKASSLCPYTTTVVLIIRMIYVTRYLRTN